MLDKWQKLTGGRRPGFNNAVYLSEKQTADRNFALGYFMRENNAFPENSLFVTGQVVLVQLLSPPRSGQSYYENNGLCSQNVGKGGGKIPTM